MTLTHRGGRGQRPVLDQAAAGVVGAGVVCLVLIGFVASYQTLRDLAVSAGSFSPWLAPAVPLSFDLGIVILSLKVVLAARQGRPAVCLRLLVAGLSTATVVANASAALSGVGRLMHIVPAGDVRHLLRKRCRLRQEPVAGPGRAGRFTPSTRPLGPVAARSPRNVAALAAPRHARRRRAPFAAAGRGSSTEAGSSRAGGEVRQAGPRR